MPARALNVFQCTLAGTSLIEASAGTGKTWNICGLYLRLLLERQLDVQQILVVTFTNAATAELRDRIRTRLSETLARLRGTAPATSDRFVETLLQTLRAEQGLRDENMAQRLDLALQTFDEASIFTIHGFCHRALTDTAFSSGLPMQLELLTDDSVLRMEVVHDFWRRHVAGAALSPALAAHLLERKDSPEYWAGLLARQLAKPLAQVIWPKPPVDVPALKPSELDAALTAAHAAARATWQSQREQVVDCVLEALPRLNGQSYKASTIATAAASWDSQLASAEALAAPAGLDKLDLYTPERLKPKKNQAPAQPHVFFEQAATLLDLLANARQALARERQRLLQRLLGEAPATLRALKRERRVIAFDDMLYNLHEKLCSGAGAGLAAALRTRFPAALIDEFQDTDPLQFAIFKAVYGSDPGAPAAGALPLFLVGDPKQAIYSFRNADLNTYLQARSEAAAEYTLADNQRSSRELLTGLNGLFSINPRAFVLPGLEYRSVNYGDRPRKPWQDGTLPRSPLQLWELPQGSDGQPLPKTHARRAAASACAGEIARLLGAAQRGEIRIDNAPLTGGDIAVLVRSHAQGSEMRRALAVLGVGSVELSQSSVFESPDAEELERVLAAILEPARDRLLRAALATDMLGFDAAAIEGLSADETRLLGYTMRFTEYRDQWLRRGVGPMLRSLLVSEGVNRRLLARGDGERRLTNLLHLSECLHQASASQGSPERLLRWLQTQRANGGSDDRGGDATQLRLESDRNLVQIITIHKSKGLEFPVVFCPFAWDGHPGGSPSRLEGREYHDAAGRPVIDFRDEGVDGAETKTRIALDRAAENLRLIYVALTRAVQRCYLVVGVYTNQVGKNVLSTQCCRSSLNSLVAGAGISPADWLQNRLSPAAIRQAWVDFSAAHPGSVGLSALPAGPWSAVTPARLPPETLAALPPPADIPRARWIGSYSSLTLGARHEGAAIDHDERLAEPAQRQDALDALQPTDSVNAPELGATAADDDVLHFPRGPAAGNCIHAVFEHVDFTEPATWPAAIAAALREQPPAAPASGSAVLLPRLLERMLGDVLHTPLPGGVVLARVPRQCRLVELEFNLPAARLTARALSALLQEYRYPVPALGFGVLEGYLRGYIDLVFEHDGRYYILDWKSNHLGSRPADYGPAAVAHTMREHGYHLQYLLYAVALHRHLKRRVPDYRYGQHFGGAIYLFVRGVRPGWRQGNGQALGVHHDLPPEALIERLSALLTEPTREPA